MGLVSFSATAFTDTFAAASSSGSGIAGSTNPTALAAPRPLWVRNIRRPLAPAIPLSWSPRPTASEAEPELDVGNRTPSRKSDALECDRRGGEPAGGGGARLALSESGDGMTGEWVCCGW